MPNAPFKLLSLGCVIALVTGCATITPDYLDHSLSSQSPGTHPVTVAISNVMLPGHARPYVLVDGKAAATLGGGQAITMYLPGGRHHIAIGSSRANDNATLEVAVSEQSPSIVRAQYKENGHDGWTLSTSSDSAELPGKHAPSSPADQTGLTGKG